MIRAVICVETRSFLRNWRNLATVVIWPLSVALFTFFSSFAKSRSGVSGANWLLGITVVLVVWGVPPLIASRVFLHERAEGALSSVLASPISVADLFLGKAVAAFLLAYLGLLAGVVATLCALGVHTGVLPDVCTFAMALLAMPACGFAIAEVIGILCLLMGSSTFVVPIGLYVNIGPVFLIALLRISGSSVWVFLALTVVGLATDVALLLLFSRLSKTRLVR